jgi:diguanylate cyclase (GGDEF)-like protein
MDTKHTITAKLTRIYLVVAVSVLLCSSLVSQVYLYLHARAVAHENLRTQVVAMAGNLESAVIFGDHAFAQQILDALQHYPEVQLAVVLLPSGQHLARYQRAPGNQDSAGPLLAQFMTQSNFMNSDYHGVAQRIENASNGTVKVLMVASLAKLNRETLFILLAGTGAGALLLYATYTVFRNMSRNVTRPIEALTLVMRQVERDGDHSQRAQIESNDEIGELAHGFNAMLAVLERQNSSLNQELDERKVVQAKLDRLAHFDTVTHLPNRHYFHERLRLAVTHSINFDKLMAVVFVDLDNFKLVNDSYGHDVGDQQLRAVADRLTSALRSGDVVCRLGGDEFALILEHLSDLEQAALICEKIVRQLSQPLCIENHDIVVSASVGFATCPADADKPETLLRFADAAMYAAKGAGKNTWRHFEPKMAQQSTLRLTLENQMRIGLQECQFEVHYQPQISMETGTVCGLEALARWNHPERGYIIPAQFIPVAEESGQIQALGEWVMRTACEQIVVWEQTGMARLKVAVNVSVRQLAQANFVEQVMAILTETACPPDLLEIEITESMLMQNPEKTCAMLDRLRKFGIGIAIDDFGTGYSSMAQLKHLPVTKLKIDKSFVDDIAKNASDQAIATAISTLARSLQIRILAEGVENQEQVEVLRHAGCHEFQGYYFSRPLLGSQVVEFIGNFESGMANGSIPIQVASDSPKFISRWGDLT